MMCNIPILRALAGLTKTELASKSGLNLSQISKLENGQAKLGNITFNNILKLAEALNCSPLDFKEIS